MIKCVKVLTLNIILIHMMILSFFINNLCRDDDMKSICFMHNMKCPITPEGPNFH